MTTFLDADHTLNIAHRGASAAAPPNTLAAFEKAIELGADGIEFDVHLSPPPLAPPEKGGGRGGGPVIHPRL
jgi:hypothetical protein